MNMFDVIWRYNLPIVAPIVSAIQIKHVHSSVSYQWAIYQKYHLRGRESPSGYGALKNCQSGNLAPLTDCPERFL